MNYLKGKKVYLSGPMHLAIDDGAIWRDSITPKLKDMGMEILDPCRKPINANPDLNEVGKNKEKFRDLITVEEWKTVKHEFWPIVRCDLRMVDHCDFIIFNYNPLTPMVGSIHELVVATFEKKVVLLKYDRNQLSDFNPWMATFIKEHHFFAEWEDMFDYLRKVDEGVFDTSLWVI
jgi:hypothetical protein